MKYNRHIPNYPIGTKAFLGNLQHTFDLGVVIVYKEITVVENINPTISGNVITYNATSVNGGTYKSSSHWSEISTDKFDLVYKYVAGAIEWSLKNQNNLNHLIKANKKTEHFKEAFNLYIELNAEKFI